MQTHRYKGGAVMQAGSSPGRESGRTVILCGYGKGSLDEVLRLRFSDEGRCMSVEVIAGWKEYAS